MQAWKLHYQFYSVRANNPQEAIELAIKQIAMNPAGFVIEAVDPTPTQTKD